MLDNNTSMQKRVLLATAIAFIFFLTYNHFYTSKIHPMDTNTTASIARQNQEEINKDLTSSNESVTQQGKANNSVLVDIVSDNFIAKIDTLGRISYFTLEDKIFKNVENESINLVNANYLPLPLEIRFSDKKLNDLAFSTSYSSNIDKVDLRQSSENNIVLTQNLGDIIVTKTIKFYKDGHYDFSINLNRDVEYFTTPGFRPDVLVDGYTVHGAIIKTYDDKIKIIKDSKVDTNERYPGAKIAAASDRYYTTMFYNFDKGLDVILSQDSKENAQIFIKQNSNFKASGYIGPKNHKTLTTIDSRLVDIIEYGWFTFIAKPMFGFLSFLHNYVGNWGWAIVILTIVIRVVLYPLTYKGMVSMNKMKEIAPKIKEIQEKYKQDTQKMQMHVMELYKKHGANPMSGCLPILLQIPIFFAIYRVLLNAIELKGAPWIFWINDLADKDPFFILPILMGLMMFLQQKITPTTFTDPMQEKIIKFLPIVFTIFFVTFPAGLTLYWFINNTCSVVQQYFINRVFDKQKKQKEHK